MHAIKIRNAYCINFKGIDRIVTWKCAANEITIRKRILYNKPFCLSSCVYYCSSELLFLKFIFIYYYKL